MRPRPAAWRRRTMCCWSRSTSPRLPLGRAPAELIGQRLALRRELEADRIDAIALAGRRRPVGEHMALVGAAASTHDLDPDHAVTGVADGLQMPLGEGCGEARPTGAALELLSAAEQR